MKKQKIISLVLSALLLLGCFSLTAFAQDQAQAPVYVVLGDSIAYGSGLRNPVDAVYGKIVADTNGYTYINRAVPGHTTKNLINRLADESVAEDVKKADIISVSIGGNDFLMNNLVDLMFDAIVKKDYSDFDAIGARFYANLSHIVDIINELNPDAVILMQTLYNPQSGRLRTPYQGGADRINAAIERYNAENPGEIVIVDVATALSDTMDNFADDCIHPSALGNEKIAVATLEVLQQLSLGTTAEPVIVTEGEDVEIPKQFMGMLNIYAEIFHILSYVYDFFAPLFVMPL